MKDKFFVYTFEHIDNLDHFITPTDKYIYQSRESIEKQINRVKNEFLKAGWEGDGEIKLLWMPPFAFSSFESGTHGRYIWHVKQNNDGTSFIGSDIALDLKGIAEQNSQFDENDSENNNDCIEQSIIQNDVDVFVNDLDKERRSFEREISLLEKHEDITHNSIAIKLMGYTQCQIVAKFSDFINDCYLRFLIEVIMNSNKSGIKLRKSSVKLDLSMNFGIDEDLNDDGTSWLTTHKIVSDIWHSFMFEPYSERIQRVCKAIDFCVDQNIDNLIKKHIEIRNCIQHHNWQLHKDSLAKLGGTYIEIDGQPEMHKIYVWKRIVLTKKEILILIDEMMKFAKSFGKHANDKIISKVIKSKDA